MTGQSPTRLSAGAAAPVRLLRCVVGAQTYGLHMAWVRGIRRLDEMRTAAAAPGTTGWVGYEGQEVPVVDLAARLALPHPASTQGKVVLCQTPSRYVGLLVERLDGMCDVPAAQLLPLPRLVRQAADPVIEGVVQQNGSMLLTLAPERLHPCAGSVGAAMAPWPAPEFLPVLRRRPTAPGAQGAVLCFTMAEQPEGAWPLTFGLSLSQVAHMQQSPTLCPVPGTPPHVLGLVSWQGYPLAMIDLSRCLGGRPSVLAPDSRLLIARAATTPACISFPVRPQVRVRALPLPHRPSDRPLALQTSWLRGRFDLEQETLLIPDLDRLLIPQEEQGC
ncbi:MAG: chemotaxis protein CheW [Candidatus Tectimicrobiota bacterium]